MPETYRGTLGRAEPIEFAAQDVTKPDHSASLAHWLLTIPSACIAWSQYLLGLVHLRPIDGVKPAHLAFAGASHELMVFALDPREGPYTAESFLQRIRDGRGSPIMRPVNYVEQVAGLSDEQAVHLAELLAKGFVDGVMSVEPGGIMGAREFTKQVIANTVEHIRTGGHHSPALN